MKISIAALLLFLCIGLSAQLPSALQKSDRLLIVSGGGASGAWGAGLATALCQERGYEYQAVFGSSTGSLIAPFVHATDKVKAFRKLKSGYTNVTSKEVFNRNPFKTKGKKKGGIKGGMALRRILCREKTLGESKNLKKLIKKLFTEPDFNAIKQSEKDIFVTVVNILKDSVEFKSIKDYEYEEFVNWMWASANFPVFMSLYSVRDENRNRQYYVDGGIKESIPLEEAVNYAHNSETPINYIDVIIHSTDHPQLMKMDRLTSMKLLSRTIDVFRSEVRENDIELINTLTRCGQATAQLITHSNPQRPITVNFYFMPEEDYNLIPNQLVFEKGPMEKLWKKGYQTAISPQRQNEHLILHSGDAGLEIFNCDTPEGFQLQPKKK